jgi:hypothetical protein
MDSKPVLVILALGIGGLTTSEIPPNALKAHVEPARSTYFPTFDINARVVVTASSLSYTATTEAPADDGNVISTTPVF